MTFKTLSCFPFPKTLMTTQTNAFYAFASPRFVDEMKLGSLMNTLIWGVSNTPALNFFFYTWKGRSDILETGSFFIQGFEKNCLIRPNFICSVGNTILFLSTNGILVIFLSTRFIFFHNGHSLWTQYCLALLSQRHRKHGHFA